jgi:uncharacterized protein (TIGR03089 family)
LRALTPAGLLTAALAADPASPLLTYYDDVDGARVELSVATFANWVAKTANLLVHGLDRSAGDRAVLLLPLHWLSAVAAMGCWTAGLAVTGSGSGEVAFAAPDRLREARSTGAEEVVAVSLRPLGGPLGAVPIGITDYGAEVLGYGDSFSASVPLDPAAPALDGLSGAQLVDAARAAASRWGLGAGDRVLSVLPYDTLDGWLVGLLAPLVAGGGVVLCQHLDVGGLAHKAATERVTAAAGIDIEGVRRLL